MQTTFMGNSFVKVNPWAVGYPLRLRCKPAKKKREKVRGKTKCAQFVFPFVLLYT